MPLVPVEALGAAAVGRMPAAVGALAGALIVEFGLSVGLAAAAMAAVGEGLNWWVRRREYRRGERAHSEEMGRVARRKPRR